MFIIVTLQSHIEERGDFRGRLVHVFLVSGMGFVYSKPILLVRFYFPSNPYLKPTRYEKSYPKEEVGMKHKFEESTLFVLFLFLFMSLNSNY